MSNAKKETDLIWFNNGMCKPKPVAHEMIGAKRAKAAIDAIERIAAKDVGRNITALAAATRGELYAAADHIAGQKQPAIGIVTGFFIPTADPPAAETDGPIGAAHLAGAFKRAGIPVQIITDSFCQKAVRAAAGASAAGVEVMVASHEKEAVAEIARGLRSGENALTHLIAVERVGPSADGLPRNMRGVDISRYSAPLDMLFDIDADKRAYATIGIGDGGNEIGMGKLPAATIAANVKNGRRIACTMACDYLMVCGVANWGAVALAAALAMLRSDWRKEMLAGISAEMDRRILEDTVQKGFAVDGVTGKKSLSVDGIGWRTHAEVVAKIRAEVEHG